MRATSPEQLAAIIRDKPLAGRSIVGLDGAAGSGKSTLATALGPRLGADVVSLDSFLNRNEGRFFKGLRLPELRDRLADAKGTTIVEGVLLLQVLEALSVSCDVLVYVKRVGLGGRWEDEEECAIDGDPDTLIAGLLADFKAMWPDEHSIPALNEEIIRYHAMYRPHERATVEYWRTEES